jgi:hypothetical protein
MNARFTSQNMQSVFTFPFRDEKWKSKLALLALTSLAGFLIVPWFFVNGYVYEIMRRIIVEKKEPSLPEWDDLGGYFVKGLKIFGVGLIFMIPAWLFFLPMIISSFPMMWFDPASSGEVPPFLMFFPLSIAASMLGSLIAMGIGFFTPAAIGHMVAKGRFGAAFQIGSWWRVLRANFGGFLLSYVLAMGASYLLMFVTQFMMMTVILCLVVPFLMMLASSYIHLVSYVLYALAYADGAEKLAGETGSPIERRQD